MLVKTDFSAYVINLHQSTFNPTFIEKDVGLHKSIFIINNLAKKIVKPSHFIGHFLK